MPQSAAASAIPPDALFHKQSRVACAGQPMPRGAAAMLHINLNVSWTHLALFKGGTIKLLLQEHYSSGCD
ncbi:g2601 [Coccomyxa elongata]